MTEERENMYLTLDDFLDDMDDRRKDKNKFIGMEFIYEGVLYRINNESLARTYKTVPPGVKFMVFIVHWIKYPYDLEYETIGEFSSMDELLKDLKIKGRPFTEIITDPKTRIDCRDDEVDYKKL